MMKPETMQYPDFDRLGFEFTEEQRAVYELMSRFAGEQLAPAAAARDQDHTFPSSVIDELAALGGMAMKVSESDLGPGMDNLGYALAVQSIARIDASVAVVMVASNLASSILARFANEDQRERYLRPLASGKLGAAAFALTEPHAGSDAAAIRTNAVRDGNDWILSGSKQWITSAAGAKIFTVFAKTPADGQPANSVTCFVVEAGTPGFSLGRIEDKMGLRSSGTAQLFFENCRVPDSNIIGKVGDGFRVALGAIAPSRVAIAAQSIGIAERAFELGLSYAQERTAFSQPIADFQNSRFVLADSRMELDQAWLLMLRAASLLDKGVEVRGEAAMAKLAASETCGRIVDRMLQLHGGNGYSREYEIERLYRDARVMRIYEGTSEIQREVIARDLLGK
jgi:alkylation response protein AidB-like acyl-CoA dehydrogenase